MARPITPELVLTGYMRGAFPMCEPGTGRVEWFTRANTPHSARTGQRHAGDGRSRLSVGDSLRVKFC